MRAYPAYKDSGTAWLGDVPRAWAVGRLKNGFDLMKRPVLVGDGNVTAFRDGQVTLRSHRRVEGFTEADKEIGYQGIEPGDLVIHAMDAFAGAIGVSDSRGKSTPVYSVCRARGGFEPRYYALTLRHIALSGYIASLGKGVRERSTDFRWTDAQNVLVPIPSAEEQKTILNYLDAQTAKIDALIGKQEQLIETLAERRQAVISHAVTKGLDPNAEWKSSGVEWLGSIPKHWSVPRVAHNFSIVLGKMVNAGKEDQPETTVVPYLRAGNVQPYGIDITEAKTMAMTDGEQKQLALHVGDLVVVEGGQGGYGRSALVLEDLTGWGFQNHVMRVRPKSSESNAFLDYVIKTLRASGYIASLSSHASLPSFSSEKLAAIRYGRPALLEQIEIVNYLDRETSKIDALSMKAREMIDVLKERRQALVSAAVTGKIDVRGLT